VVVPYRRAMLPQEPIGSIGPHRTDEHPMATSVPPRKPKSNLLDKPSAEDAQSPTNALWCYLTLGLRVGALDHDSEPPLPLRSLDEGHFQRACRDYITEN
jgi:hypothetical protein